MDVELTIGGSGGERGAAFTVLAGLIGSTKAPQFTSFDDAAVLVEAKGWSETNESGTVQFDWAENEPGKKLWVGDVDFAGEVRNESNNAKWTVNDRSSFHQPMESLLQVDEGTVLLAVVTGASNTSMGAGCWDEVTDDVRVT